MVFSSLIFLFRFLPLTLLAYYLAPRKGRDLVLFLASLVFYAWGEPVYVALILFSTMVDYTTGRLAGYYRERGKCRQAGAAVFVSAVMNLSLLGFFKYADFFLQTLHTVTGLEVPPLGLPLPIGISFYTFQTMSYTIDVYRGDAKVQKNLVTFGAYVALFPQLVAGPIVRYQSVASQLVSRRESIELFFSGMVRFCAGMGKKVLIANQIGAVWTEIAALGAGELTSAGAWIGCAAFSLQIYFDFSGYSDMAIGLGKMFGFTFPENFRYPYESKSITEFWRRWHISLGTWFREYVYIPLGGNRKGTLRQMLNLVVVWFLTGLWHGAYWSFVLWGLYYGALLVMEKFFLLRVLERLPGWCRSFYTVLLTMAGWCLFSCQDMRDSAAYVRAFLFRADAGLFCRQDAYLLRSNAGLFLLALVGCTSLTKRIVLASLPGGTKKRQAARDAAGIAYAAAVFAASLAMLVNASYNPFLYFRF
ncbi:MAG: MBOAT family protein [Eubacterium sp.]|nr:MBOAT family protein [Eubacterium sp.]